jgi:hypothetical protein
VAVVAPGVVVVVVANDGTTTTGITTLIGWQSIDRIAPDVRQHLGMVLPLLLRPPLLLLLLLACLCCLCCSNNANTCSTESSKIFLEGKKQVPEKVKIV